MDINIKSAGKKILKSGSFITLSSESNVLSIEKGEEIVFCEFNFIEDQKGELKVEVNSTKDEVKNHVKATFKFFNFNNQLGTGPLKPFTVASFDNGDKIKMHLWIRQLGSQKTSKEILYTIYVEEHTE